MSAPLSHAEHLQLLDSIRELHECRSLVDFPEVALHALAPLVPSDLAAFNEVNMPRGRLVAILDKPIADYDRVMRDWEQYSAQHPLVRYVRETGDGQAIKVSDFLSTQEFHALDIYRVLYKVLGAEDQMSLTIRSDTGVLLAMAFNRDRRSFTETERLKLNLVRPHLLQAYANVEELAGRREERDDLQTALRETGHGLIALGARGHVRHATPGAPECLSRYFPEAAAPDAIPTPVAEWLDTDTATAFVLHTEHGRLIIRNPRGGTHRLLLLSEERATPLPTGGRLTAREIEVLRWLADGKSNADISAILGIAVGTVKQHVEHIFTKLDVRNRTAAATVASQLGLLV